jgi:molybdopterin-guanine dinucleotide biosynthesis protein B
MTLQDLIPHAGPCDLILIEGYKSEAYPKIEIRRDGAVSREPLAGDCPGVVAIASDRPQDETDTLPVFQSDDVGQIVDFIIETVGLKRS